MPSSRPAPAQRRPCLETIASVKALEDIGARRMTGMPRRRGRPVTAV